MDSVCNSKLINQQNVVSMCSGILFSLKRKYIPTDNTTRMNFKNCAEWNKPLIKGHILPGVVGAHLGSEHSGTKTGGSQLWYQHGLHSKTVFQKQTNKQNKKHGAEEIAHWVRTLSEQQWGLEFEPMRKPKSGSTCAPVIPVYAD